jgi:hypothetical protein
MQFDEETVTRHLRVNMFPFVWWSLMATDSTPTRTSRESNEKNSFNAGRAVSHVCSNACKELASATALPENRGLFETMLNVCIRAQLDELTTNLNLERLGSILRNVHDPDSWGVEESEAFKRARTLVAQNHQNARVCRGLVSASRPTLNSDRLERSVASPSELLKFVGEHEEMAWDMSKAFSQTPSCSNSRNLNDWTLLKGDLTMVKIGKEIGYDHTTPQDVVKLQRKARELFAQLQKCHSDARDSLNK